MPSIFICLRRRHAWGWLWAVFFLLCPPCAAEQLVIDYVISNSPQRSAWLSIIDQFATANPDIEVVNNGFPQEQYKRNFTARLREGHADLAFWYAGERLRDAAGYKLLVPLDAGMLALLENKNSCPARWTAPASRARCKAFRCITTCGVLFTANRYSGNWACKRQPPGTNSCKCARACKRRA